MKQTITLNSNRKDQTSDSDVFNQSINTERLSRHRQSFQPCVNFVTGIFMSAGCQFYQLCKLISCTFFTPGSCSLLNFRWTESRFESLCDVRSCCCCCRVSACLTWLNVVLTAAVHRQDPDSRSVYYTAASFDSGN